MNTPHRKQVRHFEQERQVHELTFSCFQRRALLNRDLFRSWFCQGLHDVCEREQFYLLAYVLMPEHVHLIVLPTHDECRVSRLLANLKRPLSRRVKQYLVLQKDSLLNELTVHQRPGMRTFRFWQEGPGYDRNLSDGRAIQSAIEYVHANPVRRGLCVRPEDWPWSSAARLIGRKPINGVPRLHRVDLELFVLE